VSVQRGPGGTPDQTATGSRRDGNASVLNLQRMAGNRAVAGLMRSPQTAGATKSKLSISITGEKQGAFKGTGPNGAIQASHFHLGIVAPVDVATNARSGQRRSKPITFKKPFDASSPQFMQAIDTNEKLTTVTINFLAANGSGQETVTETITLQGAAVVGFDQDDDDGASLETVTLTYESMVMTNPSGGTSASDSTGQSGAR
jgi:type VI secretion system Hcp family effector